MKKSKKKKVPFLKDCFNETFHNVQYFARRLKYICDSIFIQSKKTGLSWKYGYMGYMVWFYLVKAPCKSQPTLQTVLKTLSRRLHCPSEEPWTQY